MSNLEKGRDIAERLLDLAARITLMSRRLPKDRFGRHISFQVLRSVTGAGSNYDEARAAESRADFIHKVGIAAKEVRETVYWLTLIERAFDKSLAADVNEARELASILMASKRTALANRDR